MNNIEAIKWLKKIKESIHGGDDAMDECRREALDLAIGSLPAYGWDVKQIVDLQKKNDELMDVIDVNGHEINILRECLDGAVHLKCCSEDMNRAYERLVLVRSGYDEAVGNFSVSLNAYDSFLRQKRDGTLIRCTKNTSGGDEDEDGNESVCDS